MVWILHANLESKISAPRAGHLFCAVEEQRACGQEDRPIETERETTSVSKKTIFATDTRNAVNLKCAIQHLADGVGRQLRQEGFAGTTIKLQWNDFTTLTRQVTPTLATNHDHDIYAAAIELFERTWIVNKTVRLIKSARNLFQS